MRIKKVKFSNINNLKGDHEISFDQAPLSEAGIFAISGPTGSGKSTILDVITLALYNRIPRHGRVSKKAILDHGSVMTHHTNSATASVEYEVAGQIFTSAWSVERARTGNLKDYEMTLMDALGSYQDIKKSDVPSANAEIIGLNYDQFVKSIILSQGDFARFLKADKNERGEMLEKLTGTQIYRKISVAAYEKHKFVSIEMEKVQAVLAEMRLMEADQIEELEKELTSAQAEGAKSEAIIKDLRSKITIEERRNEIESKLELLLKKKSELRTREVNKQGDEERLKAHLEVADYSKEITRLADAKRNFREGTTFISGNRERRKNAETQIEKSLLEIKKDLNLSVTIETYPSILETFENEVKDLDRGLATLTEKGKEIRASIKQLEGGLDLALDPNERPESNLDSLLQKLTELETRITSAGLKVGGDIGEARTFLVKTLEQVAILKEVLSHDLEMDTLRKTISENTSQVSKLNEQEEHIQALLTKRRDYLSVLKDKASLLAQRRDDQLKIASLDQLRGELSTGDACPLCGSTSHPYTAHLPTSPNDLSKQISENESLLKSEEEDLQAAEKKIHEAIVLRNTLQAGVKTAQEKLANLDLKVAKLKAALGKAESVDRRLLQELEARAKGLEAGLNSLNMEKEVRRLIHFYENLIELRRRYKEVSLQRKEKFSGDSFEQYAALHRNQLRNLELEVLKTTELEADRSTQNANSKKIIDEILLFLKPIVEKSGRSNVEDWAALLLPKQVAEEIKVSKSLLEEERIKLETRELSLQNELKNLTSPKTSADFPNPLIDLASLRSELLKQEQERNRWHSQVGEKLAVLRLDKERRSQSQEMTIRLAGLRKDLDKWSLLNRMIGSAKGDKFANYAQSLTLKNLLAHTNRRLKDLSDRYLLNRPGSDGTLSIIDQYQGNIERAVTTLSGGEVFIISLALALSLSDMASKNIALECLFIDEGFGTLDQETLDIAMNTLEKLQSENQKMVGVISHVEALKERITTQIQLKKNAQGYSKIAIIR